MQCAAWHWHRLSVSHAIWNKAGCAKLSLYRPLERQGISKQQFCLLEDGTPPMLAGTEVWSSLMGLPHMIAAKACCR